MFPLAWFRFWALVVSRDSSNSARTFEGGGRSVVYNLGDCWLELHTLPDIIGSRTTWRSKSILPPSIYAAAVFHTNIPAALLTPLTAGMAVWHIALSFCIGCLVLLCRFVVFFVLFVLLYLLCFILTEGYFSTWNAWNFWEKLLIRGDH